MGTRDPRIDAYIAKQQDFAKPVLRHLREVVHAACPEVEETLKWRMPFFVYRGGALCSMAAFIRAAMKLNDEGIVVPKRRRVAKPEAPVPPELERALAKNRRAGAAFEKFPPSHRREYVEWVAEAKREETKARRAGQAVEWIADGKSRHWKYQDC